MFVPQWFHLGEVLSGTTCFSLFWIPLPPVGSTPWKLSDNIGHFSFEVKMQLNNTFNWKKGKLNFLEDTHSRGTWKIHKFIVSDRLIENICIIYKLKITFVTETSKHNHNLCLLFHSLATIVALLTCIPDPVITCAQISELYLAEF